MAHESDSPTTPDGTCDTCGTNPATTTDGATIVNGRLYLRETVCESCNIAPTPVYLVAVLVANDDHAAAARAVEQGYADHSDVLAAIQPSDDGHRPTITVNDARTVLDRVLPDSAEYDLTDTDTPDA